MATKKVSLKVPTAIEVGNVDVEFEVRDGATLLGTVTVSRGGVDWRASGKRSAVTRSWKEFADLMAGTSAESAAGRSRGRSSTRTAPPARAGRSAGRSTASIASATGADAATVRAWARDNGYDVNDRGAIPAAVRDAYRAANAS